MNFLELIQFLKFLSLFSYMIFVFFCMYFLNNPSKYVILFRIIINTSFYCIFLHVLFAPFKMCSIFVM